MPELPEVETVVSRLNTQNIVGTRIREAFVDWERTVGGDRGVFVDNVVDQRIESISRRGKQIVLSTSRTHGENGALIVHLRMSGRLYVRAGSPVPAQYERVTLLLENGNVLSFYDPRKFGRVIYTRTPRTILDQLGVEPLAESFRPKTFFQLLNGRKRRIKPLLLDQHVIAGMGNIYTDESLWIASIHPMRRSDSLSFDEAKRLWDAIRFVLAEGIAHGGTQLGGGKSNFSSVSPDRADSPPTVSVTRGTLQPRNQQNLRVFQKTGNPCPRCGTPIERIIVGQRATHICPDCQVQTQS